MILSNNNEIHNSGEFGGFSKETDINKSKEEDKSLIEDSVDNQVQLKDLIEDDLSDDIDLRGSIKVKYSLLDKLNNDNISSIVGQDDPFLDKNQNMMLITTIDGDENQIPTFREHAAQSVQSIGSLQSQNGQGRNGYSVNTLDKVPDKNFPYFSLTEDPQIDRKQEILIENADVVPRFANFGGNLNKDPSKEAIRIEKRDEQREQLESASKVLVHQFVDQPIDESQDSCL